MGLCIVELPHPNGFCHSSGGSSQSAWERLSMPVWEADEPGGDLSFGLDLPFSKLEQTALCPTRCW